MAKQLLRFALSRLDILDTQALDLENLDFALGRNTVLEFRDVGLVLQVGLQRWWLCFSHLACS
jgi:autophagy-related protein 2